VESFATQDEAEAQAAALWRQIPGLERVIAVVEKYLKHKKDKGNKESTVVTTEYRLMGWLDPWLPISEITHRQLKAKYEQRRSKVAVDTHRNELQQIKSFFSWCVQHGYCKKSPADGIEPMGRRNRGKEQLRRSESQAFYSTALGLAQAGDECALAALSVQVLGLRNSEALRPKVRDVDVGKDGVLLWIIKGKTKAATRYHDVAEPLAGLLARYVSGRNPNEWLFPSPVSSSGHRESTWLRDATRRICELAGVPKVTPQGMRGTLATLTTDAGRSSHVVSRELGHASQEVTRQHYIQPGATERARARKMFRVLEGGQKNAPEIESGASNR